MTGIEPTTQAQKESIKMLHLANILIAIKARIFTLKLIKEVVYLPSRKPQ